jgi:prostaglandin-endoperoxide synthase 2
MLEGYPLWLMKLIAYLAAHWKWFGAWLSDLAINNLVNACRPRPHPWSTAHDYVSWVSLSDRRWSARHLPAKYSGDLPPAEQVIGIFRRPTGEQRLCDKSTCLFPAFAQYLTDGFIRTRMPHSNEPEELRKHNTSNHQIDLCPLYGRVVEQTDVLRLKSSARGERGRLKTQLINGEEYAPFLFQSDGVTTKPEYEVLDIPLGIDNFPDPQLRAHIFAFGGDRANSVPQVAMMNTLFLREHNRLAGEIEKNNPEWDDERVFQIARNITIVLFIKIVVEEYINHISPAPFRFRADPSVSWGARWNQPNWITTEFSLLYRWHSLIPDTIEWGGTSRPVAETFMNNRLLTGGGLAHGFADMSSQRAARLGAFNTADALLGVEMLAINQGRLCSVASFSDYRAYVSQPRPRAFTDISSDSRVADFLKTVYKSPDDVEFYVGLFAQEPVRNSPLPPLLLSMVAIDAFSQALTNPLLSENIYGNPAVRQEAFTEMGLQTITDTGSLRDIVNRNTPGGAGAARIAMTREGWQFH